MAPTKPLTVYGPEPLVAVLQGLLVVAPRLPFPLHVAVLEGGETSPLQGLDGVTMGCIRVDHDVPCLAYGLTVPRAPRFDPDRARELGVPMPDWRRLQHGEAIAVGGRTVKPEHVSGPPRRGLRLVYATDTCPIPALRDFIHDDGAGTDLLIADGMYGDEENKPTRWDPQHMTFAEAATLARDGGARRLWLTHFSPSVPHPETYRDRATAIFPATTVGHDGLTMTLSFDDD